MQFTVGFLLGLALGASLTVVWSEVQDWRQSRYRLRSDWKPGKR